MLDTYRQAILEARTATVDEYKPSEQMANAAAEVMKSLTDPDVVEDVYAALVLTLPKPKSGTRASINYSYPKENPTVNVEMFTDKRKVFDLDGRQVFANYDEDTNTYSFSLYNLITKTFTGKSSNNFIENLNAAKDKITVSEDEARADADAAKKREWEKQIFINEFIRLMHQLVDTDKFKQYLTCVLPKRVQPRSAEPNRPEPVADETTVKADDIIAWATKPEIVGPWAMLRKTIEHKLDPAQYIDDTYYDQLDVDSLMNQYSEVDDKLKLDKDTGKFNVDDESKVKSWIGKIYGIINDLTEAELVDDEMKRGEYVIERLKGNLPHPGGGEGSEPGRGEEPDAKGIPWANVAKWLIGTPEVLGELAMERPRKPTLTATFTKSRAVIDDEAAAQENDAKYNETQSSVTIGNPTVFSSKWLDKIVSAYKSVNNVPDEEPVVTMEKLSEWLEKKVFTEINKMTWTELDPDTKTRGEFLRNRLLGKGRTAGTIGKKGNNKTSLGQLAGAYGKLGKFAKWLADKSEEYDDLGGAKPHARG